MVKINEMKSNGIDPLILDAGDILFSTTKLNESNIKSQIHRANSIIKGYEKIGCHVINIGKYEILNGLSFLNGIVEKTNIPFISANLKDLESGDLLFQPYKIFERDGLNIGVIGVTDNLPDTSKNIMAEDFVKAGNRYIDKLKNEVDVIVLLANCERGKQASLNEKFPNADFVITSGSTNMTRSTNPQADMGPLVYSCGKQGKYLITIDLTLRDKNKTFVDITAEQKKIDQIKKRFDRLQKKNPNESLEEIYANQTNVLKLIDGYKKDEIISRDLIKNSVNKLKYNTLPLNRNILDDPDMLKFVNSAVSTCEILNPKKVSNNGKGNKSALSRSKHHGHNH